MYNLGNKTVLYLYEMLLTVLSECKTERNTDSKWSKQEACFDVRLGCGSLLIITPVSLLANKLNVRSVLHGQMSLAAVSHIVSVMRL